MILCADEFEQSKSDELLTLEQSMAQIAVRCYYSATKIGGRYG